MKIENLKIGNTYYVSKGRSKGVYHSYIYGKLVEIISNKRVVIEKPNGNREICKIDLLHKSADKAVERMEELGLVNDESYALHYAQKLIFTKHMSKNAVVYELARKGIDKELAAEILDEIEVDSSEQIRMIIDKKYKNISDEKIRRRAVAALQRLGYRWDEIKGVIEEYAEDDSI